MWPRVTSFIRHHIKPYVGAISLTKLSSLDLQRLYNKLKDSGRIQTDHALPNPGLSAKTVRSIHMMLSSCLAKAHSQGPAHCPAHCRRYLRPVRCNLYHYRLLNCLDRMGHDEVSYAMPGATKERAAAMLYAYALQSC